MRSRSVRAGIALRVGLVALLGPGAAAEERLPRSPDEIRCPPQTTLVRAEYEHGTTIWCRRADGAALGPYTEWYPSGQLYRYRTYVADGEGTVDDGVAWFFQPDGSVALENRFRRGQYDGEQLIRTGEAPYTKLYEAGVLLDVYQGSERPPFSCPHGLIRRVRTRDETNGMRPAAQKPPHTLIESWCEDPEAPELFPRPGSVRLPESVSCIATAEGVVSGSGRRHATWATDRLPFPPGFDPADEEALAALCARSEFWREGRREGPYVSRGKHGEPHEEGSYRRGLRHGVFRVVGRACVEWRHGERLGRVPCPTGPEIEPDPWVEARWEELDAKARALGWPALEDGAGDRELRIWRFPRFPSDARPWGGRRLRALRLRVALDGTDGATGEIVGFDVREDMARICPGEKAEVCRFDAPSDRSWEDAAWELELLDAWTLPPADAFRMPEIADAPWDRRAGFFLEVREEGRVRRDWYGAVRHLPFPETFRTKGIADLVDALWTHRFKFPPKELAGGDAKGG